MGGIFCARARAQIYPIQLISSRKIPPPEKRAEFSAPNLKSMAPIGCNLTEVCQLVMSSMCSIFKSDDTTKSGRRECLKTRARLCTPDCRWRRQGEPTKPWWGGYKGWVGVEGRNGCEACVRARPPRLEEGAVVKSDDCCRYDTRISAPVRDTFQNPKHVNTPTLSSYRRSLRYTCTGRPVQQ